MSWIDIATPFIQDFESCQLVAYHGAADAPNVWTCGWGQTGPDIHEGTVWTQQYADSRFADSLGKAGGAVDNLVTVPINDNQKASLSSFVYNLGQASLEHSTLLRLLNQGDYNGASGQFPLWNHANGQVVAGLTRRRLAEQTLFNAPPTT